VKPTPPSKRIAEALSPTQLEAATCIDRPVCILAGAGSGKTRVVTHRIAHLIDDCRQRPWSILAVTFTNKAAGEMRHRVSELVPGQGKDVQVGTFHATAARYLRRFGGSVGVPSNFTIYDQDDAERLLKRVLVGEMGENKELVRPIKALFESWQSEGLAPSQVPDTPWNETETKAREAYARYTDRLSTMGAVDFGGLLVKLRDLLKLPAGDEIFRRVGHVLVDEYQDTNAVQAEITLMLARRAHTIAVVGDDDQAIYGWRGASADNLKRFIDGLEGAQLVRLEDNYRSTRNILDAANGVIANNEVRLGKTLRATGDEGRPVRVLKCHNDVDEARKVVRLIQESARGLITPEDVAVLYRANALSRPFEDELRRAHLSYRVVGGVRFYDRKEVKDVLATVRAGLNPKSDVDALRMIQAVPRGIGQSSVEKIQAAARAADKSVLETMADDGLLDSAGVTPRVRKKAVALAEKMLELGRRIRPKAGLDARAAIALATEVSGVADRLEAEGTIEAEGRLENLNELLSAAAQHASDALDEGTDTSVSGFLETAALTSGSDTADDEGQGEKVTLMTLHAAKGLEFKIVFLVGLEEHGFPHTRALSEGASSESALEEERRLAYVGITRARERLYLSWAQRRMVQGSVRPRRVSRFLEEIPMEVLEGDVVRRAQPSFSRNFFEPSRARSDDDGEPRVVYDADPTAATRRRSSVPEIARSLARVQARTQGRARALPPQHSASADDAETRVELDEAYASGGFEQGARVEHEIFGIGTVVGMRGSGRTLAALVQFDDGRAPRMIIARHLRPAAEDEVVTVLDPVYEPVFEES
jgi:DNA helicase-2/ATP-dependent DNA helicase PcrA